MVEIVIEQVLEYLKREPRKYLYSPLTFTLRVALDQDNEKTRDLGVFDVPAIEIDFRPVVAVSDITFQSGSLDIKRHSYILVDGLLAPAIKEMVLKYIYTAIRRADISRI